MRELIRSMTWVDLLIAVICLVNVAILVVCALFGVSLMDVVINGVK